jgi:D-alanine transaminase
MPSPSPLANLNGQTMPLSEVRVSALDRGFLFGDAVYEVLRVYGGRPWLCDEHFERLARSLESIRLHGVDLARLRARTFDTLRQSGLREATIYIQVTRGAAPRRHAFPDSATPLELLWVQEYADPYTVERRDGAAVHSTPDIRWERCDIKSTNLLANVLAMQSAKEAGCLEAVFYLPDGTLTEGSHSNLFGVEGGRLRTAPLSPGILPGTTRRLILQLAAEEGIAVDETPPNRNRLEELSEMFLSGTTTEVMPVVRIDGRPVGEGRPGPVTRQLQDAYRRAVEQFVGGP